MITNTAGIVQYVNPAYELRSGYAAAELVGYPAGSSEHATYCTELAPAFFEHLARRAADGESWCVVFAKRRKNGTIYHEEQLAMPVRGSDGRVSYYVLSGRQPASPSATTTMTSPATHDLLTGVANRRYLIDHLWRAVAAGQRRPGYFALLHIDIERFRRVNEAYGHRVGDRLLAAFAERIVQTSGPNDVVARLGDDGFAVLTAGTLRREDARRFADALISSCSAPYVISERTLHVRISVGIAHYPDDGANAEALLRRAEIAVHQAKASHPGACVTFDLALEKTRRESIALEQALGTALANGEFTLRYQPIVCTSERRSVALEALLRWKSTQYGEVPPARFLPLLEKSGLIDTVGDWLLQTACRQFTALQGMPGSPEKLCVKLSPRQLHAATLAEQVLSALRASRLAAHRLELEVSENALIEDAAAAEDVLLRLSALGVRLAIDDFGSGYSSLSRLRRLPVNTLKIDHSFISQIATHQDALVITRAIVSLAATLDIDAVAVGVDNEQQLDRLSELGCTLAQGKLFSRPLTITELCRQ